MLSVLTVLQFTLLVVAQAIMILFLAATRETLARKMRRLEADLDALRSALGAAGASPEPAAPPVRARTRTVMRPIA